MENRIWEIIAASIHGRGVISGRDKYIASLAGRE